MCGILLEDLSWIEAESALGPDKIIVIPLGAAAKEHGPHLRLNNDFLIAEYLKQTALQCHDVIVAPTINSFYYPAFRDYPGSISLRKQTAIDLIVDTCLSLHRFGVWRFFIINTGLSPLKALRPAAAQLRKRGVLLRYSNMARTLEVASRDLSEQRGGCHADEIETSIMLHIAADRVDMKKATCDFDARQKGRLSRRRQGNLSYSPSGIWGDARLATAAKGAAVVKSINDQLLDELEQLRRAAPLRKTSKQD